MNKVIMMGRIVRQPEVRYSNGMAIARYTIAVNRSFKREGEPDADFFNCIAFGKNGEFVEKYLNTGSKIIIVGRIQQDNYTNKEGQKVYGVRIIVDEHEFAESKKAEDGSANRSIQDNGFVNIPDGLDGDLPFN